MGIRIHSAQRQPVGLSQDEVEKRTGGEVVYVLNVDRSGGGERVRVQLAEGFPGCPLQPVARAAQEGLGVQRPGGHAAVGVFEVVDPVEGAARIEIEPASMVSVVDIEAGGG